MARYLLTGLVVRASGPAFPLGTFVVNVIGCAAFGALAGAASTRISLAPEVRLFWFTGIFGGFTTFSSYAFESFALIREGHLAAAGLNLAGQIVMGLIVLAAGYYATT
jgi:CrcB protein